MQGKSLSLGEYRALAEFRYQIRYFFNLRDQAARGAGLEPKHFLALLAVRGSPAGHKPTIQNLAERLQVRHHSAVELVDRLVARGLVERARGIEDRREVLVRLTPRGKHVLERLGREGIAELRRRGPALVESLRKLVAHTRRASRPH